MRSLLTVLLIFLVGVSCGCSSIVKVNDERLGKGKEKIVYNQKYYPQKIINYNSRDEKHAFIYDKPPQRIVAVWQDTIELLLALGVGDRIVAGMGVPDKKYILPEYQHQYEKIPYTSLENLDVETIMMLEPDFIIGWYSTFTAKVLRSTDFWQQRGINTYITPSSRTSVYKHKLEDEYSYILDMGKIFDKNEKAQQLVTQMQGEIDFVTAKTDKMGQRPRAVIIEFLGKEISVYGEKTLAGDILTSLGGDLIAKNNTLSLEQLVDSDPDVIFLVIIEKNYGEEKTFLDRIYKNKALSHLRCVRNKRVYTVPLYAVYSSGIRTYDGIKIMAHGLYPELYEEK
jgi:iron complex transport system substrate-binding protein